MVGVGRGMGRGGSIYRKYFNTEKERGVRRATEKDSIALRAGYVAGGVRKWLRARPGTTESSGTRRRRPIVIVREGAPSTSCSAGNENDVDGRPSPTMTETHDSATLAAFNSWRALSGPKRCVRGLWRYGGLARPSGEARGSIGYRKGAARPIGLDASVALCGPRSSSVLRSSRCRPYGRPVSGTIGRAAAGGAA
jgi:hypothetical protein